jgi:exonuclease III
VARLTVATLNTRGIPVLRSRLAERYHAIADTFEAAAIDVVSFQEVFTYYHLRQLTRRMPSFRYVSYRRSVAGPAGGLATLSRSAIAGSGYQRFPMQRATAGLPRLTPFMAWMKGALVTRLLHPRICVVNTHPVANLDGDWSSSNRFYPVHRDQLTRLTQILGAISEPSVVCGDFNIARESTLHRDFMSDTQLVDAFEGRCPPTFHAEYLNPGESPQCIDFVLITDRVEVESADVLLTGLEPLPGGPAYVSDHLGLRATVLVPA